MPLERHESVPVAAWKKSIEPALQRAWQADQASKAAAEAAQKEAEAVAAAKAALRQRRAAAPAKRRAQK